MLRTDKHVGLFDTNGSEVCTTPRRPLNAGVGICIRLCSVSLPRSALGWSAINICGVLAELPPVLVLNSTYFLPVTLDANISPVG